MHGFSILCASRHGALESPCREMHGWSLRDGRPICIFETDAFANGELVGMRVGGEDVVVGFPVGARDGMAVVGESVGKGVVGEFVGALVGEVEGLDVGLIVGAELVGLVS